MLTPSLSIESRVNKTVLDYQIQKVEKQKN